MNSCVRQVVHPDSREAGRGAPSPAPASRPSPAPSRHFARPAKRRRPFPAPSRHFARPARRLSRHFARPTRRPSPAPSRHFARPGRRAWIRSAGKRLSQGRLRRYTRRGVREEAASRETCLVRRWQTDRRGIAAYTYTMLQYTVVSRAMLRCTALMSRACLANFARVGGGGPEGRPSQEKPDGPSGGMAARASCDLGRLGAASRGFFGGRRRLGGRYIGVALGTAASLNKCCLIHRIQYTWFALLHGCLIIWRCYWEAHVGRTRRKPECAPRSACCRRQEGGEGTVDRETVDMRVWRNSAEIVQFEISKSMKQHSNSGL